MVPSGEQQPSGGSKQMDGERRKGAKAQRAREAQGEGGRGAWGGGCRARGGHLSDGGACLADGGTLGRCPPHQASRNTAEPTSFDRFARAETGRHFSLPRGYFTKLLRDEDLRYHLRRDPCVLLLAHL